MSYLVNRPTQNDVSDLQTLSGVPDGSTNLGTFTGKTVRDNPTVKQAVQDIETEVDDRLPDFIQWGIGKGPGYASNAAGSNVFASSFWQKIGLQDFTITADIRVDASGYYRVVRAPSTTEVQIVKASSTITTVVIGSQSYNFSSPALAAYSYHNITFVADRDGNGKLFTDGELTSTVDISSSSAQNLSGTIQCFAGQSSYQVGHRIQILNRAVTDAEAVLLSLGQRLGFADRGASGSASYTSDFSAGVDGWTAASGTLDGNIDAIGGEDNTLRYTATADPATYFRKSGIFSVGKRYRVSVDIFIPSSNIDIDGVRITIGGSSPVEIYNNTPTADSWVTVSNEVINTSTGLTDNLIVNLKSGAALSPPHAAGTDVIYIKNVVVTPIGEVLSLLPSGAAPTVWADQSGNGYNGSVTSATLINPMPLHADAFVSMTNLPTSSAGLATGRVWNDSGTLKVV